VLPSTRKGLPEQFTFSWVLWENAEDLPSAGRTAAAVCSQRLVGAGQLHDGDWDSV